MEDKRFKLDIVTSVNFIANFFASDQFDNVFKAELRKNLLNHENVNVYNCDYSEINRNEFNKLISTFLNSVIPADHCKEIIDRSNYDTLPRARYINHKNDHLVLLLNSTDESLKLSIDSGIASANVKRSKELLIELFLGNALFNNPSFKISTKAESWDKLNRINLPIRNLVLFEPYLFTWEMTDVEKNINSLLAHLKNNFGIVNNAQVDIISFVKKDITIPDEANPKKKRRPTLNECDDKFKQILGWIKDAGISNCNIRLIYMVQHQIPRKQPIYYALRNFEKENNHNRWFFTNYFWCKAGRSFNLYKQTHALKDDINVESFISPDNMDPVIRNWKLDFYDKLMDFMKDEETSQFIHCISS